MLRVLSALALTLMMTAPPSLAQAPVRASAVSTTMLDGSEGVRRALAAAAAAGTETIVVPLPLYPGSGPDRVQELLRQAHEQHVRVFASIDVDRVARPDDIPAARDHVVYRHPEWLMIPRALAPEMLSIDGHSPEYFGRLSRWTRANGVDGIYLSPLTDEAIAYVAATAATAVMRYAVDGVQLEGARYPADDFDYGRRALDVFRSEVRPTLPSDQRQQLDADEAIDPFTYPNAYPERWRAFRQDRQTRLVTAVRDSIRRARPNIPVAAVVGGSEQADRERHFQDWRTWLDHRIVDAIAIKSGAISTIVEDAEQVARVANAAATTGSR